MNTSFIKAFFIVMALNVLSGCAGINGQFGCHKTAGSSCLSVSQINARADAGVFDHEQKRIGKTVFTPFSSRHSIQKMPYSDQRTYLGKPVRAKERLQRIWIAPYQDRSNNYHESSYVDIVLEKPHWIGVSEKVITTVAQDEQG